MNYTGVASDVGTCVWPVFVLGRFLGFACFCFVNSSQTVGVISPSL